MLLFLFKLFKSEEDPLFTELKRPKIEQSERKNGRVFFDENNFKISEIYPDLKCKAND